MNVVETVEKLIIDRIRKLFPYIPGEQKNENSVIKLNTNESPYPPPREFINKVIKSLDGKIRLYPEPDSRSLREKIASYYGVKVNNVFIGNGSDEIIRLLPLIFMDAKDKLGFFEISYSLYKTIADIFGYNYIIFDNEDNFSINLHKVDKKIKLLFMPNPNSPTGMYVPIRDIIGFLKYFEGILVIDEAYIDFSNQESAISLIKKYPNIVVIRTFSKSFSLAGARLGYCIANEDIILALDKVKDSYNINIFSQLCGYYIFDFIEEIKKNINEIIQNRKELQRKLLELGFYVLPSFANFLFVKPPYNDAKKLYLLLKSKNIFVRYFTFPHKIKDYVRITIGKKKDNLALIEVIKSA